MENDEELASTWGVWKTTYNPSKQFISSFNPFVFITILNFSLLKARLVAQDLDRSKSGRFAVKTLQIFIPPSITQSNPVTYANLVCRFRTLHLLFICSHGIKNPPLHGHLAKIHILQ